MIVYHGTNIVIDRINLDRCKLRTDFGKGFYLTGKIGTAQEWAVNRTYIRGTGTPTILRYTVDFEGLKSLTGIRFPDVPTAEWLDFVCMNRERRAKKTAGNEPKHAYHWVSGPIADDRMNDVVEEYFNGEITPEEAIHRAKILPQTYQLSLHTIEALAYVDEKVFYRQRKGVLWLPKDPNWKS